MSRSLQAIAGIDLRSLAAFRIGLGMLVWLDQFVALTNARVFYSDAGILPRSLLGEHFSSSPWIWSLHTLSGAVSWEALLMIVAMAAATAVVLGWRTRAALFIAWVLTCSLQARNPTILYSGDVTLRLLCFWGLFLPLDARWSISSRQAGASRCGAFTSMATVGLLVQVASIYWFTAALKYGNEWTRDGTALYYVLMNDQFVRGFGRWLLGYPDLCRWLTRSILCLELAGPFLAFIPWRTAWWRMAVVTSFWLLHLGMFLCLRLGCFPFIMMVAWLPFVPGAVWDRLLREKAIAPSPDRPSALPQIIAAFCLTLSLLWNLSTVDYDQWNPRIPTWLRSTAYALRLDQWWSMFAPAPMASDGWIVMDAQLADGSHVDLLRHARPVSYDKPLNIAAEAPDWKWHKLLFNIVFQPWALLRSRLGQDLAEQWSQSQPPGRQVHSWVLVFMSEETLPHYMAVTPHPVELARSP